MADLYDVIKNMISEAFNSYELCDMELGVVLSLQPLSVKISDRITLNENQLLMTQTVTQKTISCSHTHESKESMSIELTTPIIVREGIATGDEILLLKVNKGQKYIILSKVVKP